MKLSSNFCWPIWRRDCSCSRSSAGKAGWACGRGYAASRLHVQIVGLFAVIAAVPTVLVSVVASTTLDRGLDRFFSTRTRAMIEQSMIVANAYVSEHAEAIRGDLLAMAFDLGRAKSIFDSDRDQFQKIIS